ncbi:hypothetical protein BWD08_02350 [Neisseria animaloris]|nr:hypothetical protein BWD08_02350 [Neisseria animaloris]
MLSLLDLVKMNRLIIADNIVKRWTAASMSLQHRGRLKNFTPPISLFSDGLHSAETYIILLFPILAEIFPEVPNRKMYCKA